jgi:hypothetical protein
MIKNLSVGAQSSKPNSGWRLSGPIEGPIQQQVRGLWLCRASAAVPTAQRLRKNLAYGRCREGIAKEQIFAASVFKPTFDMVRYDTHYRSWNRLSYVPVPEQARLTIKSILRLPTHTSNNSLTSCHEIRPPQHVQRDELLHQGQGLCGARRQPTTWLTI